MKWSSGQKHLRIMLKKNQGYIVLKVWVYLILCDGVKLALEISVQIPDNLHDLGQIRDLSMNHFILF